MSFRVLYLGGVIVLVALGAVMLSTSGDDEVPIAGTYRSDVLPGASSPGRVITLELSEDGKAIMLADFQNGQPAVSQEGSWMMQGADAVQITLSTNNGNPLFRAVIIDFVRNGDTLEAKASPDLFGSEGLTLKRLD